MLPIQKEIQANNDILKEKTMQKLSFKPDKGFFARYLVGIGKDTSCFPEYCSIKCLANSTMAFSRFILSSLRGAIGPEYQCAERKAKLAGVYFVR